MKIKPWQLDSDIKLKYLSYYFCELVFYKKETCCSVYPYKAQTFSHIIFVQLVGTARSKNPINHNIMNAQLRKQQKI